jgi:hypothetical protein
MRPLLNQLIRLATRFDAHWTRAAALLTGEMRGALGAVWAAEEVR